MVERIPKAKRAQVLADFERWKREQPEKKWIPYYGDILWTELVGGIVGAAVDDIRKAERELIAKAGERVFVCAEGDWCGMWREAHRSAIAGARGTLIRLPRSHLLSVTGVRSREKAGA